MLGLRYRWLVVLLVVTITLLLIESFHFLSDNYHRSLRQWIPGSTHPSANNVDFPPSSHEETTLPSTVPLEPACSHLAGIERIVVAVKTGATVAGHRLPPLLRTSLNCVPNVHLFSDMEQEIEGRKVHDALKSVSTTIKHENPDFELYLKQQQLNDSEKIMSTLSDFKNSQSPGDLAAWTLDKYKNLHILQEVWALQPDQEWYLFIDADTYVIWPTILRWTQRLDSHKILYLGAKTFLGSFQFAHGGTGYLISRAAMELVTSTIDNKLAKWDARAKHECCGDYVLALALKEDFNIELTSAGPVLDGHHITDIPFDKNRFCQPVATMHHIATDKFDDIADFEAQRLDKSVPVLYRDIYNHFIANEIVSERNDWDNLSQGEQGLIDAHSKTECRQACEHESRCTQARWDGRQCIVEVDRITLGNTRKASDERQLHSFWMQSRIDKWLREQEPCKYAFPGTSG